MAVELHSLTNMVIVVDMDCIEAPDPFSYPFPLPPSLSENSAMKIITEPSWDVFIEKQLANISDSSIDFA